jgi:predicted O-methyltransferase YrrM
MSNRSIGLSETLHRYLLEQGCREPDLLREHRQETSEHPWIQMQIAPEQGAFMAWLIRLMGATRCLEIGVFTGYSSMWMLHAMPDTGTLVACDINPETAAIAQRYWQKMDALERVDLRLAPAIETLEQLVQQSPTPSFDFVFIDADKENYEQYYQYSMQLLRPGGIILVDNVLWNGSVIAPAHDDIDAQAIAHFNEARRVDPNVDLSMLPVADGLTLLRKLV